MPKFTLSQICEAVKASLTDELRQKQYRGRPDMGGYCYIASEAIFSLNLTVGPERRLIPIHMTHESVSHWALGDLGTLNDMSYAVIDLTTDQFKTTPAYHEAHRRSFLTTQPSKRAKIVIERAIARLTVL